MGPRIKDQQRALRPEIKPGNVTLLERLHLITGRSTTDLVNDAVACFYEKFRDEQLREGAKKQAAYEAEHSNEEIDLLNLQGLG